MKKWNSQLYTNALQLTLKVFCLSKLKMIYFEASHSSYRQLFSSTDKNPLYHLIEKLFILFPWHKIWNLLAILCLPLRKIAKTLLSNTHISIKININTHISLFFLILIISHEVFNNVLYAHIGSCQKSTKSDKEYESILQQSQPVIK